MPKNRADLNRKERQFLLHLRENWARGKGEIFAGKDAQMLASLIDRGYINDKGFKRRHGPGDDDEK
jgi:hypothetical protein